MAYKLLLQNPISVQPNYDRSALAGNVNNCSMNCSATTWVNKSVGHSGTHWLFCLQYIAVTNALLVNNGG